MDGRSLRQLDLCKYVGATAAIAMHPNRKHLDMHKQAGSVPYKPGDKHASRMSQSHCSAYFLMSFSAHV